MEYMIDFDVEGLQELQHHGTKGQKWGIRRYQNADGSLTPAGRKRYGDAPDFVKKKQLSRKQKKQQAKNLEKARQAKADKKKTEEEAKQREAEALKKKEHLLKSSDAKELYKNRNLLTDQEINERINRIDLENRLKSKITEEHVETGREKVNKFLKDSAETVENVTNLYKKMDDGFKAVTGESIGKKLGLSDDKKEKAFRLDEFYADINNKTAKEIKDAGSVAEAMEKINKAVKNNYGDKKSDNSNPNNQAGKTDKNGKDDKSDKKPNDKTETYEGDVVGNGTSGKNGKKGQKKSTRSKPDDDIIDLDDDQWRDVTDTPMSDVSSTRTSQGRDIVAGLLEDHRR